MAPMTVKKGKRKRTCSVYKCSNVNTHMVYRGSHTSYEMLHICDDCVRDIVLGYIDEVGVEEARKVLCGVVERLSEAPAEEDAEKEASEEDAEKPRARRVRKADESE